MSYTSFGQTTTGIPAGLTCPTAQAINPCETGYKCCPEPHLAGQKLNGTCRASCPSTSTYAPPKPPPAPAPAAKPSAPAAPIEPPTQAASFFGDNWLLLGAGGAFLAAAGYVFWKKRKAG